MAVYVAESHGIVIGYTFGQIMRRALTQRYPELAEIRLTDFKVRVISGQEGTAAKVRTIVESADTEGTWTTIGVSTNTNIIGQLARRRA